MSDDAATYRLALPDNRAYGGLVARLPPLARDRLHLRIFLVGRSRAGHVTGRVELNRTRA